MSDVQHGPGWWLASDGRWYPPESRPQPLQPPPFATPPGGAGPSPIAPGAPTGPPGHPTTPTTPPVHGSYGPASFAPGPYGYAPPGHVAPRQAAVSTGLGGTIQGFSWALGGFAAVTALLALASMIAFNTYWNAPISSRAEDGAYDDWIAIDDAFSTFGGFTVLAGFVLWILLMIWMNSAHKTTQQLWHGVRTWASGWTVGAWFIPLAQLLIPKLVLSEIERIAFAPRSGGVVTDPSWTSRPTLVIGKVWWVATAVGVVLNLIGNSLGNDFDSTLSELRAKYILNAIGLSCMAAGAVFGALYVRAIGNRLSADGLRHEP